MGPFLGLSCLQPWERISVFCSGGCRVSHRLQLLSHHPQPRLILLCSPDLPGGHLIPLSSALSSHLSLKCLTPGSHLRISFHRCTPLFAGVNVLTTAHCCGSPCSTLEGLSWPGRLQVSQPQTQQGLLPPSTPGMAVRRQAPRRRLECRTMWGRHALRE